MQITHTLGTDHLTCKGGGGRYGYLFRSEIFFRTTRELEYIFFFQNLTLGYMTKTLNQIFSPSTKIRIFFLEKVIFIICQENITCSKPLDLFLQMLFYVLSKINQT